MDAKKTTTTKVLPFDTKQGHVSGFEIVRNDSLFDHSITHVVFSSFDKEAQLSVEIVVHWTNWVTYARKKWPNSGSIVAVLLENGTRIHAKARICNHTDDSYNEAPVLCRDCFAIVGLTYESQLLEIVGVREWLRSNRDDQATRKHLACPWERDNAIFRNRQPA